MHSITVERVFSVKILVLGMYYKSKSREQRLHPPSHIPAARERLSTDWGDPVENRFLTLLPPAVVPDNRYGQNLSLQVEGCRSPLKLGGLLPKHRSKGARHPSVLF